MFILAKDQLMTIGGLALTFMFVSIGAAQLISAIKCKRSVYD